MYSGRWAQKAVPAVQVDGGKMTLEDLASYQVTWGDPVSTDYQGYMVYGDGLPYMWMQPEDRRYS